MTNPEVGNIQIVPTTPESAGEIESLARAIWTGFYTPLIGAVQVAYMLEKFQSKAAILSQLKEGILYFLIREREGKNIGYLALVPKAGELFLSKFYMMEENRGKGCGRQALEWMRGFAREKGFPKISLLVNKRNPSVRIYQKIGFQITASPVTDIGGGFVMDDYRMEWLL